MARFLVDEQLPPGLAIRLAARGHVAEHVNRIGPGGSGDKTIWAYAKHCGAVLVTKDEDFVAFARRDPTGPQVVWIRIGNIANDALWEKLDPVLNDVVASLESGDRIVEVI